MSINALDAAINYILKGLKKTFKVQKHTKLIFFFFRLISTEEIQIYMIIRETNQKHGSLSSFI